MKKTVSILLAAGFLAAAPWSALAGGHGYSGHGGYSGGGYYRSGGWPAGAFFACLIGGAILTTVIASTQPAVAYAPPPAAYVPPPLCPQSKCAKFLFNGQCGGSRVGWCEVFPGKKKCIYVRGYDRLKSFGEEKTFKEGYIPPRNWALDQTSSWANYFLKRDHHAAK